MINKSNILKYALGIATAANLYCSLGNLEDSLKEANKLDKRLSSNTTEFSREDNNSSLDYIYKKQDQSLFCFKTAALSGLLFSLYGKKR